MTISAYDDNCVVFNSLVWMQRGPELLPKDEEGNVIFDDVSYVETWKVIHVGLYTLHCVIVILYLSYINISHSCTDTRGASAKTKTKLSPFFYDLSNRRGIHLWPLNTPDELET